MTDEISASDFAYRCIRDVILTGTVESGAMLGEISLSKQVGVRRTPVRTALTLLQDEGRVSRYPKRSDLSSREPDL